MRSQLSALSLFSGNFVQQQFNMSVEGTATAPRAREIPSRRVVLNNLDQLPGDYSTTPGGTFFSTTPGGTRIVYDRSFLLECRNSPLTKSPPPIMTKIPGITEPGAVDVKESSPKIPEEKEKSDHPDQPQFEMDI